MYIVTLLNFINTTFMTVKDLKLTISGISFFIVFID